MEMRIDPLTGDEVVIVGHRQDRPNQPEAIGCPFCVGGIEAPLPYDVRAFPNRWPTFPDDRCEVVLYSPDHDASLWTLGATGVRRVIDLWAERTEALGRRPDVAYVLVFENRGAEAGATIAHPHGQIYGYETVPAVPASELDRARSHGCPLCTEVDGALVVATRGSMRAWVPVASGHPYGLLVAPTGHRGDLPSLPDTERDDLAAVLVDVLQRLDLLFGAPMPLMMWWHQAPTTANGDHDAHLHLHIAPIFRAPAVARFIAGAELGSGMLINSVAPEDAAAALRAVDR